MINKQKVVEFRDEFQKAVEQLEKDFGVTISLGTISFNANELRSKMTARVGKPIPKLSASDFSVGDVVFINHKKIANTRTFEILKINKKNIKVRDRDNNSLLTVSPSLLSRWFKGNAQEAWIPRRAFVYLPRKWVTKQLN